MLIALGVISGIARSLYPTTLGSNVASYRDDAFGMHGASAAERRIEVAAVEARFAAYPSWIVLHASVGSILLVAGALQFVPFLRTRHLRFHKWNGRVLIALSIIVALTAVFFGVIIPAEGVGEAVIIGAASLWFLIAMTQGALAIRRKDKRNHGQWMIRASAIALGVPAIRIVAAVGDLLLTPRGWGLKGIFLLSLVVGWAIAIVVAELWLLRAHHDRLGNAIVHRPAIRMDEVL